VNDSTRRWATDWPREISDDDGRETAASAIHGRLGDGPGEPRGAEVAADLTPTPATTLSGRANRFRLFLPRSIPLI
jgi:hypothetical protein